MRKIPKSSPVLYGCSHYHGNMSFKKALGKVQHAQIVGTNFIAVAMINDQNVNNSQ